jgi:acyl-CoA synthetase (AMP-forming)/AMP-acid ligase II
MLIQYVLDEYANSSHPAVICAEKGLTFSYAGLSRMSMDTAGRFLRMGIRPGDRVAILLPGSIEFAAAFFATVAAGAVAAPLDIYLKKNLLLTLLDTLKPRLLVTNHQLLRKIRSELEGITVCLVEYHNGLSVGFPDGDTDVIAGSPDGSASPSGYGFPHVDPAGDAVIIMSSGSTGMPKAVRLSHRAVIRNIMMHLESLDLEFEYDIRGLQVLPMNFSYGLIASFLSIIYAGGTAVLLPYLDPKLMHDTLARYGINLFMGTPTHFRYMIENCSSEYDFSSLPVRGITLGGDQCRRYTLDLIMNRFPAAKVYITYGLSEAGPRVSTLPPDRVADKPHSIGLPLKGVEVSILAADGRMCKPHEHGEIVVKTPSLMSGYFGDEERTNLAIRDGRCHTGDIGYMDEEGFLYYVGRQDRRFKLGGRYVNPNFIEQCIASNPHVQEVTVEKLDSERDEVIRARIKAKDAHGEELLHELKRLCRQHMPAYMVPGEFEFEERDYYSYKGKKFVPVKEALPEGPLAAGKTPSTDNNNKNREE